MRITIKRRSKCLHQEITLVSGTYSAYRREHTWVFTCEACGHEFKLEFTSSDHDHVFDTAHDAARPLRGRGYVIVPKQMGGGRIRPAAVRMSEIEMREYDLAGGLKHLLSEYKWVDK